MRFVIMGLKHQPPQSPWSDGICSFTLSTSAKAGRYCENVTLLAYRVVEGGLSRELIIGSFVRCFVVRDPYDAFHRPYYIISPKISKSNPPKINHGHADTRGKL